MSDGILYVLKAARVDQIKIGVTGSVKTLQCRLAALGGQGRFDLAASHFWACPHPRTIEQFLHLHFANDRVPPSDAFVQASGNTECFSLRALPRVLHFMAENGIGTPLPALTLPTLSSPAVAPIKHVTAPDKYDAHVAQFRIQEALDWNKQVFAIVYDLLCFWNDNNVIVGRYLDDGVWRLALRNTAIGDPLEHLEVALKSHPGGQSPYFFLKPVVPRPPRHLYVGPVFMLFRNTFNSTGEEYGCVIDMPPFVDPAWVTDIPHERLFHDDCTIDPALASLAAHLASIPVLEGADAHRVRTLHKSVREGFYRHFRQLLDNAVNQA